MITLLCLTLLSTHADDVLLPQWMTPEERLRIDEIGKGHTVTAAPEEWVETPGEFEPLQGVFITWRYGYGSSQDVIFRDIVREVVETCKSFIIVRSGSEQSNIENYLSSGGVPLDSVEFMIFPNNTIWIRDYGPWFMRKQDNTEGIVDFIYNRPRPDDDTIPWRIGDEWSMPVYGSPLTHAGGNFMVDGLGTGFTSDLIITENPSYTPEEIDSFMLEYSGIEQLIIMPRINIEYTHHIDLWAKILNDTLVMVGEYASGHPNYDILNQNADSISRCMNREGYNYRVVRMPMPWSMSNSPPSYLNSLFVNEKVLVPLWKLAEDDTALLIYQQLFPDYEIIGTDCSSMAGSGGAIHCITMQAPSPHFIHVKHYPLQDTTETLNDYRIRSEIMSSSDLLTDSTLVFYIINNGPFTATPLSAVVDTPGVYEGFIPAQSAGDSVHYYLLAMNIGEIRRTSPKNAPNHIYSFYIKPLIVIEETHDTRVKSGVMVYPNPVRRELTFVVNIPDRTQVKIEVYDVLGQRAEVIIDEMLDAGSHTIRWNFKDARERELAQGTYFYRITTDKGTSIGKILLIH